MKLGIKERIVIKSYLPVEGSMEELKAIEQLAKSLDLTKKEEEESGLVLDENQNRTWTKNITKEFNFKAQEVIVLSNIIKMLDEKKAIPMELYKFALKILNM